MTETTQNPKATPPVFPFLDISTSQYLPKGYAVVVGTVCSKCRRPYEPLTLCPANVPYGHIPDIAILKTEEENHE